MSAGTWNGWHRVRPNDRASVPVMHVVVDTEAVREASGDGAETHRLRLGCAIAWRHGAKKPQLEVFHFQRADQFWRWLTARARPRSRQIVWMHNATYDLSLLDTERWLEATDWETTTWVHGAPPVIIKARRERAGLTILDSLNVLRFPLQRLADWVGIEKPALPADDDSDEVWAQRCEADVRILQAAVERWLRVLDTGAHGNFAPTLASQAHRSWRHTKGATDVVVHRVDPVNLLERRSYLGARSEAFRLGHIPHRVWLVDGVSWYPAAMVQEQFPTKLVGWGGAMHVNRMKEALRDRCMIADVVVSTPRPDYPCRLATGTVHPVGQFRTTLTTPDLVHAIKRGRIVSVNEWAAYDRGPVLAEWAQRMLDLRRSFDVAGDEVMSAVTKGITNSLVGKLGQRSPRWDTADYDGEPVGRAWVDIDEATGEVARWRQRHGLVQRQGDVGESRDSVPAIAAHIVAHGRARMRTLIEKVGRQHVHWVCVDGLLVDVVGMGILDEYIDPQAAGALRIEEVADAANVLGAGALETPERLRVPGLWGGSREIEGKQWIMQRWKTYEEMLSDDKHGQVTVERAVRAALGPYRLGHVGRGGTVTPFRLTL